MTRTASATFLEPNRKIRFALHELHAYTRRVIRLVFVAGTLEVRDLPDVAGLPPELAYDKRSRCHRAPAMAYADVVLALHRAKLAYQDDARTYPPLPEHAKLARAARPYQTEALAAWSQNGGRGVVVLPTGAGKSHLAMMAIEQKQRATLVVVPTLDLVRQWYDLLRLTFSAPVGVVGGGEHQVEALTVTTYDSAYIHMEHMGNRFGMVVFDECHHLPSDAYALAARQCLAPYRLGLSATPERADGRHLELTELVGPVVFSKDIIELSGTYLAEYDVITLPVHLSNAQREEYDSERAVYIAYLRAQGISMGTPRGFGEFIMRSATTRDGQRAMAAYRRQKDLAVAAPGKLEELWKLLVKHRDDRMLIFTQDNRTAYQIARQFLIPVITHQTKITERSEILSRLADGQYNAVVTSKVLNEGVDVPEASVAVIVSGSGSVREHVQRLGRILRPQKGKHALLYEIVSAGTNETGTSDRRREHDAYR